MKVTIATILPLLLQSAAVVHASEVIPLAPPALVAANSSYLQKQPWVAADNDGNFVVSYSWLQDVYYRRFDRNGNPLGLEETANPTIKSGEQDETYIAMDPVSGDFAISWSDRHGNDGFQMGCAGRFFRADGVPYSPEQILNTHTNLSQFEPYVAYLPSGIVMAAWADAGTDGFVGCIGRMFDRFGTPLTQEFLMNEPDPTTQIDPSISCDRSSTFVAAYVDAGGKTGEPRQVLGRLFNVNGTPKGPEFLVNTTSAGMQRDPLVAMAATGDFVVVWQDESAHDGAGFGVYGRMYAPDGTPKGPEFLVNTTTAGDQRDPHVCVDYMGNFVVTWEDNSTGDFDVKIRRYDRFGNPLSGEIVVHPNTAGNQVYSKSVLSQSGQRLITVWYDDFGGLNDAYYRVFALPTIAVNQPLTPGATAQFAIDLPGMGGETYFFLPSLGNLPGISVAGGRTLALNVDPLFQLALGFPNGVVFNGFFGSLDANGGANATFQVPNTPAAIGIALNFAAVTVKSGTSQVEFLTDTLTTVIQ